MNIFSKIKIFFKKPQKKSFGLIFQDFLKIRKELKISDVKMNGKGMNFKINYRGSVVPFWAASGFKIEDALAIISIGLAIGLNLVEISQALKNYQF